MKAKILIADDEEELVRALRIRLQAEGYEVVTAHNGIEAIEAAHRYKPDLILLDIMMPAGDGYSVCEKLKSRPETQNIPIVFLTAKTQDRNERKGYILGAEYYIKKPFDTNQLLEIINKVLSQPEEVRKEVEEKKILSLLLLIDNEAILELLLPKLKEENFVYSLAKGEEEMFHLLMEAKHQLLLLDFYLRGADIFSLLSKLSESEYRCLPLILLASAGDSSRLKDLKTKLNIIAILENPYDISAILDTISFYLQRSKSDEEDLISG